MNKGDSAGGTIFLLSSLSSLFHTIIGLSCGVWDADGVGPSLDESFVRLSMSSLRPSILFKVQVGQKWRVKPHHGRWEQKVLSERSGQLAVAARSRLRSAAMLPFYSVMFL